MAKASSVKRLPSGGLEYHGQKFPGFNKPKAAPAGSPHKKVVLAKKGDEVKVVGFGLRGYGNNYSAKARENYLSRSAGITDKSGKKTASDVFSANHWARKALWQPSSPVTKPKKGGPRKP